eukprot:Nk52_evm4s418 gene=Nk52_evmTU4s418
MGDERISAKSSDGKVMTKDLKAGVPLTTIVSLAQIVGKGREYSVAINIAQTRWNIKLDVKDGPIDPSVESHVAKGVQQYFTETFHDKDYILGTVILNAEDPAIINGLSLKSFIMETVKDAYSRSGNGFLVIMIQTDGAALTDMTRNQHPTKFNMVPDGYDSALYITNRALYNSIYLESFKPFVSNLRTTGDGKGGLMYKTGDFAIGELTQPSGCHDSGGMYGGCQYINETNTVYTSNFISSHSNDATPNRLSVHAAGTIQFLGCNTHIPFMSTRASCAEAHADGKFTLDMDFDFTLDKSDVISVKATSFPKFSGDFKSSFFDDLEGLTKEYVKESADAWGVKASKAVKDHPPKIQSLNTFRLERILFPRKNIYSYKEVHILSDLVLFGNTVSV